MRLRHSPVGAHVRTGGGGLAHGGLGYADAIGAEVGTPGEQAEKSEEIALLKRLRDRK